MPTPNQDRRGAFGRTRRRLELSLPRSAEGHTQADQALDEFGLAATANLTTPITMRALNRNIWIIIRGLFRATCPIAENGFLIAGKNLWIINRTVMVNLSPISVSFSPEYACGANGKFHWSPAQAERAPFASNHKEQIAALVQGVVVELEAVAGVAGEQLFIDRPDLAPSPLDPTQWIVHCCVSRIGPVLLHQLEISRIECPVKLRQRLGCIALIAAILVAGDRLLDRANQDCLLSPTWAKSSPLALWFFDFSPPGNTITT